MNRLIVATVALLGGLTAVGADEESRTWEGTWVNKKYNTNGTLKCVAKPGKDGKWTATFSGLFMSEKFSYDVSFDEKKGSGKSDLSGKAEIKNQKYDWTGTLKGNTMTGNYRSNGGFFGDFTLKETTKK
jgi:hypothetical protein